MTFKDYILRFCINSYANTLVELHFLCSRFRFQLLSHFTKLPSYFFKWYRHHVRTNYGRLVSCSILHVYRTRRSTLLLVSRKKRLTYTCVRWYADCGSRLGTSFLGYDGHLFIDARALSNAALSSLPNYWFIEGMR